MLVTHLQVFDVQYLLHAVSWKYVLRHTHLHINTPVSKAHDSNETPIDGTANEY